MSSCQGLATKDFPHEHTLYSPPALPIRIVILYLPPHHPYLAPLKGLELPTEDRHRQQAQHMIGLQRTLLELKPASHLSLRNTASMTCVPVNSRITQRALEQVPPFPCDAKAATTSSCLPSPIDPISSARPTQSDK
jgi:hypothetical protein